MRTKNVFNYIIYYKPYHSLYACYVVILFGTHQHLEKRKKILQTKSYKSTKVVNKKRTDQREIYIKLKSKTEN